MQGKRWKDFYLTDEALNPVHDNNPYKELNSVNTAPIEPNFRTRPTFNQIDMLNIDLYIIQCISDGRSFDEIQRSIYFKSKNDEVQKSCRYVVPILFKFLKNKRDITFRVRLSKCWLNFKNIFKQKGAK